MKVYRVEDPKRGHGIWRDFDGTVNPVFKYLSDGKCKDMPMEDSDFYREGGKSWFSATDTPEKLKAWFSTQDVVEMEAMGYSVIEFEVTNVREVSEFEVVFTRDSILKWDYIDPSSIWEDYNTITEQNMKNKILTGKELTSEEISQLVWGDTDNDITQIDSVVIDEGRWDITKEVIFRINGRYFSIYYLRGKTEMQEDYFPEQIAEEVEQIEVTVIRWIPKKKEEQEELKNEQDICHRRPSSIN